MPRLPILSGKELLKILGRAGFEVEGQRGSHLKLKKRLQDRILVTTVPMQPAIDIGTLINILRQTEITRDDLFKLIRK